MVFTSPKNDVAEQLRQMMNQLPMIRETDEAEASLCALSFQSRLVPTRHVWIETDFDGIGIGLDLEDWQRNDDGDDAVARVRAASALDTVEIVGIWLSGARLSDWYTNVNQEYKPMKPKKMIQLERNRAWQLLNRNDLPIGMNTTHKQPVEGLRAVIRV